MPPKSEEGRLLLALCAAVAFACAKTGTTASAMDVEPPESGAPIRPGAAHPGAATSIGGSGVGPPTAAATPTPQGAAPKAEQSPAAMPESKSPGRQSLWDFRIVPDGSKYKIEATLLAIGDPVHETITLLALRRVGLAAARDEYDSTSARDYVRGVFWNDDPCGQLIFGKNGLTPSTGVSWYLDFTDAQTPEGAAAFFAGLDCPLLGRSHFGNLQFLHGMASRDGIAAATTLTEMMKWAEFAYLVGTGWIGVDTQVSATPVASYFSSDASLTPRRLFQAERLRQTRARAIGSLLHMLQDSYAAGHTDRVTVGTRRQNIKQFHSYANQNHDKHGRDDAWNGGSTDEEMVNRIKGGAQALEASARILAFYQRRAPWSEVQDYLLQGPLKLEQNAQPSGPGASFQ